MRETEKGLLLPSTRDRGQVSREQTSIVLMLRTSFPDLEHCFREKVRPSPQLFFGSLCLFYSSLFQPVRSPNKALEPTRPSVTVRAPSSTSRASWSCGSSLTFGRIMILCGDPVCIEGAWRWAKCFRSSRGFRGLFLSPIRGGRFTGGAEG